MQTEVSSRLYDSEGKAEFALHLGSLVTTGFAAASLKEILESETPEERDWAVCEALAEAWLGAQDGVIWPWNMEIDKRTPRASLPGADLVGFLEVGGATLLVFGEVKSSSDKLTPPNVMNGRSGMSHQLEVLASDAGIHFSLLRWLQARCSNSAFRKHFDAAVTGFLESGNRAVALYGVLVRDTPPNVLDIQSRGGHLGALFSAPTQCKVIAIYLPCEILGLSGACSSSSP